MSSPQGNEPQVNLSQLDQPQAAQSTSPESTIGNDWPLWNCVLQEATQAGAAKLDAWSVGNKYLLSCSGPHIEKLDDAKLKFLFPQKEQEFTLHPLQVMIVDHQQAQFVVTGYKPGEFSVENLKVTDGTNGFRVGKLDWKVVSIVEGQSQPQPSPPFGPFKLSFPWWYYGAWALAIFVLLYFFWRRYRRYSSRKKLVESLSAHSTALSPFNQLNKDIRILLRDRRLEKPENLGPFVSEMEKLFRLFLVRQLTVPAMEWSDREIIGDIKKHHRKVHIESAGRMSNLFREFKKAQGAKEKLTKVDAEQLLEMSRQVADLVDRSHKESQK